MFEQALLTSLSDTGAWQKLERQIQSGQLPALVSGMPSGQRELALWSLWRRFRRPLLVVVPHDVQAASLAADLSLRDDWTVVAFPSRPIAFDPSATLSREMASRRIGVLDRALGGEADVVVASVEALMIPLPPARAFEAARLRLKVGGQISREALLDALSAAGYVREARVESPGQFAARGDLVDVYPVAQDQAVRIEFFGDEIDGIRRFDADTQRSLGQLQELLLGPATEAPLTDATLTEGVARFRAQMEARLKTIGHGTTPAPVPGWGAKPGGGGAARFWLL
jgi:transcription-repair coupling factor (superfamily II helicase)